MSLKVEVDYLVTLLKFFNNVGCNMAHVQHVVDGLGYGQRGIPLNDEVHANASYLLYVADRQVLVHGKGETTFTLEGPGIEVKVVYPFKGI